MTEAANINNSLVNDFKNRVNTICTTRNAWQQTQFKSANDALYAMLGDIYALAAGFTNKTLYDASKYAWLLTECKRKGVKLSTKPSFVQLLVKYVFADNDTDNRRISSYVRVLTAAMQSSEVKTATDVGVFIRKYGGVEEIRASLAKGTKTPAQRAASGREIILNGKSLATLSTEETAKHVVAAKGSIVLLVGVLTAQGTVDVKHVCYELAPTDSHLPARSAVNSALSNAYSSVSKATKKVAKRKKAEKELDEKNKQALSISTYCEQDKAAA